MQEVADLAGVSSGTVFRYLNGAQLREHNRLKVEAAIKELGFKENVLAIAVITGELTDIFSTSIITALERCTEPHRYNLIICDFENTPEKLSQRLKFFQNRAISGLVLFPSAMANDKVIELLHQYRQEQIPIVVVDDLLTTFTSDEVLVDNAHASFRAVEHLIHANHRRIAIVNGLQTAYTTSERVRGSLEAMHTYDIPIREEWIRYGEFSVEGGYSAIKKLFQSSEVPTAIYSTNYHSTLGAVIALNELQINIPEELSLIGFDHFPALDLIKPPLTVIEQPIELMGKTAGELIMKRIWGISPIFLRESSSKRRCCPETQCADFKRCAEEYYISYPACRPATIDLPFLNHGNPEVSCNFFKIFF